MPGTCDARAELAAALYAKAGTDVGKWAFMDAVLKMIKSAPDGTPHSAVVDAIASTREFIDQYGDYRDPASGGAARSRVKSIKDEISVVKIWPVGARVSGVSFEAHKMLNRLGAQDGGRLLQSLVVEAGGAAYVTRALVREKLKALDPNHISQPNGKATRAKVIGPVPAGSLIEHAIIVADALTVAEFNDDRDLAAVIGQIARTYEEYMVDGGSANVTKSAVKARLSASRTDSGSRGAPVVADPVSPGRVVGELPSSVTGYESIEQQVAEDVGEHELLDDQLIGNEARLAFGSDVSVSNQEHYQEALSRLRGSRLKFPTSPADDIELYGTEVYRDPSGFEVAVFVATLVINNEGNPWVKKKTGPILEVRVGSDTVGFLTPAMTERYIGFARSAATQGRPLTAFAVVEDGSGRRGRDVEIALQAMPMWHGQRDVTGLQVRTTPEYAVLLSTGRAHRIVTEQDGWWETECGRKLPDAEVDVVYRTKPWVGRGLRDGSITNQAPLRCAECSAARK